MCALKCSMVLAHNFVFCIKTAQNNWLPIDLHGLGFLAYILSTEYFLVWASDIL